MLQSMPELVPQGIKELLDDVYLNGNTFPQQNSLLKYYEKERLKQLM